MPPGSELSPPCNCDVGSVTSTFYWTSDLDQVGSYDVTFYEGEYCEKPLASLTVTIIVHFEIPEPSESYDIPAGEDFTLPVRVRLDPPQPTRPICLGTISETLPPGSTFIPDCGEGQAEGTFRWTPTEEQICIPYDIILIVGESIYQPIGVLVIRVHAVEPEPECDKGPKLTDNTGETKFYGVFVGCNHAGTNSELLGPENDVLAMHDALGLKTGWEEQNMRGLIGASATKKNIEDTIILFKDGKDNPPDSQPGDEFLFYFSDHSGRYKNDADGNEDDGKDETIEASDGAITEDELAEWLSGFPNA